MDETIKILLNYGAIGACLIYFIYKDNKTSKEINNTLESVKEVVSFVKEWLLKKGD